MSAPRPKFTSEFKQEAVALVRRSGQSANQVAKELGVSQTALRHWLREATRSASSPNGLQAAEELKVLPDPPALRDLLDSMDYLAQQDLRVHQARLAQPDLPERLGLLDPRDPPAYPGRWVSPAHRGRRGIRDRQDPRAQA